ncbi:GM13938 [Drosophila sechellia]|uniref:GM13938 n=1 Tax=Drosophila sechellia TaxID=7238 RepID=B4HUC8_DROSE|nr:GM13938 [Drosophila sechellia]
MQEDERQKVIDRNLPHLVCVLLGTPIDDKKNGNGQVLVDPAIFHKCLTYARCHIADPNVVDCDPDEVWDTLNHFLMRFCIENLSEFGDTFNQLANVVLNHPICMNHKQRNIHWRLLDFVLSVNYKAFVSIRRNLPEMEQKRRNILEALKMTTESSQVDPKVTNNTKSIAYSESVRVTHKKRQKPKSPRKKLTPDQIQRLCDEIRDLTSAKHNTNGTI